VQSETEMSEDSEILDCGYSVHYGLLCHRPRRAPCIR